MYANYSQSMYASFTKKFKRTTIKVHEVSTWREESREFNEFKA
jgi:hypothetical protein